MAYTTITDPSAYFQISTYDGNGSDDRNITYDGNSNMQPDWLWFKRRNQAVNHILFDSTRGVTSRIHSNNTNAAAIEANFLQAFNSDGFQVGTDADINGSGGTFVSWGWKANGSTTASNSNGTITSTVQANTTAGFSIISYTGNGSDGATIGHGLSQTPQIFFPKCLSTGTNWEMYYFPTGGTKQYGYLNLTNAFATWSYTAPTSTTIGLSGSGDSNGNGRTMIGYAFHSVQGYSKIGTYTGNGADDGPFVYTGFKPAFLMAKKTSGTGQWFMWDNKRTPFNVMNIRLLANTSAGDDTSNDNRIDFLSNGFKIRDNSADFNDNGATCIYLAFAENPFVATNGVPATAR